MQDATGYRRRVRAWVAYDWATSAFTTTVLAAVFPVYYSSVAGATLPTPATATQYYTLTLSASVLVVAVLSPILGAAADVAGWRKRFLLGFLVIGLLGTAPLVLVGEGDWLLASVLFVIARIGNGGANVFYDALLPHVATTDDMDRVSARGYAMGYLGGGLLLAVNVGMIFALPDDDLGVRLSLLSVALWWGVFSVPLIRHVPEPPGLSDRPVGEAVRASVAEIVRTLRGLRAFPDLRRYLLAFLVYNDAINVVISIAAIYGAELGFAATELILAILLVQFVGMGYALAFGALPSTAGQRRRRLVAFVLLHILLLPAVGVAARTLLPGEAIGTSRTAPAPMAGTVGLGEHPVDGDAVVLEPSRAWAVTTDEGEVVARAHEPGATATVAFTGQAVEVTYGAGPDHGQVAVELDGRPVLEDGEPLVLDATNPTPRLGETVTVEADDVGAHTLTLRLLEPPGAAITVQAVEVLPLPRQSNLPLIFGLLVGAVAVAGLLAWTVAPPLVARLADGLTTKGAILLALTAYLVLSVWGFALDSVVEFWFLAWMVAVVQGGSQALSRSLYARLIPETRSGEFFGFFSILSKFASFLSPLVFAASVALFASSRPAVLVLAGFFALGMWLLRGVDVARGTAAAAAADAQAGISGVGASAPPPSDPSAGSAGA